MPGVQFGRLARRLRRAELALLQLLPVRLHLRADRRREPVDARRTRRQAGQPDDGHDDARAAGARTRRRQPLGDRPLGGDPRRSSPASTSCSGRPRADRVTRSGRRCSRGIPAGPIAAAGRPRREWPHRRSCASVSSFGEERLAARAIPAGVAVGHEPIDAAIGGQGLDTQQRAGQLVEAADVAVEQVDRIDRLAAHLGVEVEAARSRGRRAARYGAWSAAGRADRCGTGRCPSRSADRRG